MSIMHRNSSSQEIKEKSRSQQLISQHQPIMPTQRIKLLTGTIQKS